jgi:ubiquinone/menaquinone biosynthesis C-methylase UbiE
MDNANQVMIEAWNTVLFEKFSRFRHLIADGLSKHSDAALQRSSLSAGDRVLDVGSGFGDCTLQIAERVRPNGAVVGVDCAERFIRAAEAEARDAGARNVRYLVEDAAAGDLNGRYDHAFSRFGTMFFAQPGNALRHIRDALRPGGTFTQIVWRRRQDNPWLYEAELRVREIVPVVSHEDTDQVHCGPGPFSMADADMVSSMLRGAGFDRVSFERFDCDICIGRDMDDALEFAMALGPAGEIIRLAGEEGQQRRPQVVAALRDVFGQFQRHHGIWAPSSTWFISASNPTNE